MSNRGIEDTPVTNNEGHFIVSADRDTTETQRGKSQEPQGLRSAGEGVDHRKLRVAPTPSCPAVKEVVNCRACFNYARGF